MEYNPYELLYMSRKQDSFAAEALFLQYRNYALSIFTTLAGNGKHAKDMSADAESEIMLAIFKAADCYREDYGASFVTFMTLVVRRSMMNLLRHYYSCENVLRDAYELDAMVNETECSYDVIAEKKSFNDPQYSLRYKELMDEFEEVVSQLSPRDQDYVQQWKQHYSYKEGCRKMHVNRKNWYAHMRKVKLIIKQELDLPGAHKNVR